VHLTGGEEGRPSIVDIVGEKKGGHPVAGG